MRKRKFIKTTLLTIYIGLAGFIISTSAFAQTRIIRVVTYNIEADTDGYTGARPGLIAPVGDTNNFTAGGVLEGIGEELVNDNAQPLDILALEETTSNTQTIVPIVNALNAFYGVAGMYSYSTFQATSSSPNGTGNGPNALIYNTKTVRLIASVGLTPPSGTSYGSSSGMYRQVVRYQFAPAGVAPASSNQFYIYVSHYKASTGSANEAYRQNEAQIIRSNSAALPTDSRILYVGDYNTGVAAEGMYVTLIAPGINQAIDPVNPSGDTNLTWDSSSTSSSSLSARTYSPTAIHYRDDYQMMTTNVYYGFGDGLKLVSGAYHVFGNNGSISYLASVTSGANTALANKLVTNGPVFISASQLYTDLTGASDHLPMVADYTIPIPAPIITNVTLAGANLILNVASGITNADYVVLASTNVATPLANWIAVATNTANSGNFTCIATNAVDDSMPQRFFRLQTK